MPSITEKIKSHIDSLSEDELNGFFKRNFEVDITNFEVDLQKAILFCMITGGYEEYKQRLIQNQNVAFDKLMDFNSLDNDRKGAAYFEMYKDLKYYKTDEVVNKFNDIGLRNPYLNHFVEFEIIENFLFGVIQSGIFVPMLLMLIIVDDTYDERIAKEILEHFMQREFREKYDGRKNVPELEIEIRNMLKRRNYSNTIQRTNRIEDLLFGKLVDKVEQINLSTGAEINLFQPLFDVINLRLSGKLRENLIDLLNPVVKSQGRPVTIKLFKPFFHILFEDNYKGLLTIEGFENEQDNNEEFEGTYRGNYNSYYSERVKTLAGI